MQKVTLRHAKLNQQLQEIRLKAVDVSSDGNCFFRAASCALCGHEGVYLQLRETVTTDLEQNDCIIYDLTDTSPEDGQFVKNVQSLHMDGFAVGQDAIMALDNVLKRAV